MMVTLRESQRDLIERVLRDYAAQVEWYFRRYGPEESWPFSGLFNDYKGGPACNFCGFRPTCKAWEHERMLHRPGIDTPRVVETDMTDIDGKPITFTP